MHLVFLVVSLRAGRDSFNYTSQPLDRDHCTESLRAGRDGFNKEREYEKSTSNKA